jgi:hypothetical protein
MNKCSKCGFEVSQDANFCSNCGVALKDPMPEIVYFNEAIDEPVEEIHSAIEVEEEIQLVEENKVAEEKTESVIEIAEENNDNEPIEQTEEEKPRRILWMPEWAFYSAILIIGIVGIVTYKFINDPSWSQLCDLSAWYNEDDTISQIDGLNESANLSVAIVDSVYEDSVYTPLMNALDAKVPQQSSINSDSAYHVVVMTLKSLESAQKIVDGGRFENAYILSDSTLHRIAIYSSPIKEDAKHFLDSVANNGIPGAWVFHGLAK